MQYVKPNSQNNTLFFFKKEEIKAWSKLWPTSWFHLDTYRWLCRHTGRHDVQISTHPTLEIMLRKLYISELMSEIKEKYPPNITTDLLMTKFFNITIVILGNTFFFLWTFTQMFNMLNNLHKRNKFCVLYKLEDSWI